MRPPLDDPRWRPLKAALEALALQIGSKVTADALKQAMASARLRSMRRNLATGEREWLEPPFWLNHVIDVVTTFGSVRGFDPFYNFVGEVIEGFAFYVWKPDLDRVFGTSAARFDDEDESDAPPVMPGPKQTPKRNTGGRERSLTPEQIDKGIDILRNQPKMTVEAAPTTLRDAGIKGSDSALYRLVIKAAYT